MSENKLKILFYDLETTPLKAWVWRMGDQVVRHNQLDPKYSRYDIICITYCWNDGKPAEAMGWGYEEQDSKKMLAEFDELIKSADIVIGKNSDRFDNKHLNMHRMFNQAEPLPHWEQYTDDLEKQFRKHFGQALPSHALDYISSQLGLGGKIPMEFSDWIDILEKRNKASYDKMLTYGKKDVEDTRAIWEFAEGHLSPKHRKPPTTVNMVCSKCGSNRIHKRGVRECDGCLYQLWYCINHHGYSERTRK